jgi:thioredoxin reductase (NADPH)
MDCPWPVVDLDDGTRLFAPSVEDVASRLGLLARPSLREYDLSIYGAGPAGLSAAVYAASEGLRVIVLEKETVGGQAGYSSLIENYLGFPGGIQGTELAERARQQAIAFGAELLLLRGGILGHFEGDQMIADLNDGSTMASRSNICATGVEWRRLNLAREDELLGQGVYYGAGLSEAADCEGEDVVVVGGGNSAGQAVMNLSLHARTVTMLIRGKDLAATLSTYLIDRIRNQPNVRVLFGAAVVTLHGIPSLEGIDITSSDSGLEVLSTTRLFICIGGRPDTGWANGTPLERDRLGYLVTGPDLDAAALASHWPLQRAPFFLETNVPGSFAAGDVRKNSIKRVASAVGEGAMAVTFAHRFLAEKFG